MAVKIYIAISIIAFILLLINNISLQNIMHDKYNDKIDHEKIRKRKKNIAESILSWIKMVFLCFIPIYNIALIVVIVFFRDKIKKATEKAVMDALEQDELISK